MNIKQKGAKYSLQFIKDGMIIGLGGGQTIQYLAEYVKEENLQVKVVTPSKNTALTCQSIGLEVLPTFMVDHVDVAFDSCDEIDENFHALKSGGGIHTAEKIIGSMASSYILMVDDSKYGKTLSYTHPVVLEVIEASYSSICRQLKEKGLKFNPRTAKNKDGIIISDFGNILLEVQIENYVNPEKLYDELIQMVGVVEISIFTKEVTDIVLAREDEILHFKRA